MRISLLLFSCCLLAACSKDEPVKPDPVLPALSLNQQNKQAFFSAASVKIACEGTSLTYGMNTAEKDVLPAYSGYPAAFTRSRNAYPFVMISNLKSAKNARMAMRAWPGDRTPEGLQRWADSTRADLAIIEYGTNDAFNFGGLQGGILAVSQFKTNLKQLAERRLQQKAWVILCLPPDVTNGLDQLSPYRIAVREVAAGLEIPVFDVQAHISGLGQVRSDLVHLNNAAYERWGCEMSAFILAQK